MVTLQFIFSERHVTLLITNHVLMKQSCQTHCIDTVPKCTIGSSSLTANTQKLTADTDLSQVNLLIRGGVDDTRLEAKAKDTKNPRPRTALPRTDTLEAKDGNARGQGQGPRTQAQVLSKKKGLHKNFSGDLKKKKDLHQNFSGDLKKKKKKKVFTKIFQAISTKKRFPKNFSSAPQNFNNSINSAVLEPRTGQFSRT